MINVSNEYRLMALDQTAPPDDTAKATIILADGTVLNVTDEHIVMGGLRIDDATSDSNKFQLGAAVINQCTLELNNVEETFSSYDFTGAIIRPYVGRKLSSTIEWLPKGEFTADFPSQSRSIISIKALDNMVKFDCDFKDAALTFPTTALLLLTAVCTHCGVSLATTTFTNYDFVIAKRPNDEALTCHEVVSWIAQIAGCFARCNNTGALELKWYDFEVFEAETNIDGGHFDASAPYASGDSADGGNFTDYSSGDNIDGGDFNIFKRYHHIYSLTDIEVCTDDVVVTGVQVKAMGNDSDYGETVLFGTEGYIVRISDNYLIQENTAYLIANSVGTKIVGTRFRPLSIKATADPSREAGDVAFVTDRKQNTYQCFLSDVPYRIGYSSRLVCDAESPSRNSSTRYSQATKTIVGARKIAENKISTYDLAVKRLTNLMTYSFGAYPTEETLEDGSTIYYVHDKPTLAESMKIWKMTIDAFAVSTDGGTTWNAGFDAEGNAVMNILSAIGINAEWIKVLTSFTVGNNFSVAPCGKMTASNADLTGKITATEGNIAGMDITTTGLKKSVTVGEKIFTSNLNMDNNGFWLQSNNTNNTDRAFVNVLFDEYNYPVLNLVAATNGNYDNDRLLLNGVKILPEMDRLNSKISHITNYLITHFGYDPTA